MSELTKPEIEFPGDEPPTELVVEDITVGDGEEATAGRGISAHYVGSPGPRAKSSTPPGTAARPWTSRSVSVRSSRDGIRGC